MRARLLRLVLTVPLLAALPAVAQAQDSGARSVLTPPPASEVPPLPVPIEGAAPPARTAPVAEVPSAETITAVPLPPPDQGPSQIAPPPGPAAPAPVSLAVPESRAVATAPDANSGKPAPVLPTPAVAADASPADFLRAARGALAAGRAGEARSALEMAQTRLLARTVDAGQERVPSDDLAVKQISEAIEALSANDRMSCLKYIEFASRTIGSALD